METKPTTTNKTPQTGRHRTGGRTDIIVDEVVGFPYDCPDFMNNGIGLSSPIVWPPRSFISCFAKQTVSQYQLWGVLWSSDLTQLSNLKLAMQQLQVVPYHHHTWGWMAGTGKQQVSCSDRVMMPLIVFKYSGRWDATSKSNWVRVVETRRR